MFQLTALNAALEYAQRDWPVLPLQPHGKTPLTTHGFKDASTDVIIIRAWWQCWPTANIGIVTGTLSGLLVLDVDPRHGGDEALANLERQHGPLPHTIEAQTGGGGRHVFFHCPDNQRCLTLVPGLDVKANGGYVVVAPSVHPSGTSYAWHNEHHPNDVRLATVPSWLLALMSPPRPQTSPPPTTNRVLDGARNTTLASLAGSMRRRGMTPEAIEAALLTENAQRCEPPLADDEVRGIATSISRYTPAAPIPSPGPTPTQFGLLTDVGNCLRFTKQHQEDIRYCPGIGWLIWDGKRWAKDDDGGIMRLAKMTALRLYDDAKAELQQAIDSLSLAQTAAATGASAAKTVADKIKNAYKSACRRLAWAETSQSRTRLEAMLALAQSETPLLVRLADLDADLLLFNCNNGTIDLRNGHLRAHRRDDLITKMSPVNFDPAAQHAMWEAYLATATGNNADLAAYLRRWAGYAMTGKTGEEQVALLLGNENTGKTTFIEALAQNWGNYASTASFETFLERSFANPGGARPDLARLPGVRLLVACEAKASQALDGELLKRLSGGDTVTVRPLYQTEFEFVPTCKVVLATNQSPRVNDRDGAMWRRLRRLPFEQVVPKDKRDPAVKATLRNPAQGGPAVLAWAVRGCLEWQQQGLGDCAIVEAKTAALRADMDPLTAFYESCCMFSATYETSAKALREEYEIWCRENGGKPIGNREWGARLRDKGCVAGLGYWNGIKTRTWKGIALSQNAEIDQKIANGTDGTDDHIKYQIQKSHFPIGDSICSSVLSVLKKDASQEQIGPGSLVWCLDTSGNVTNPVPLQIVKIEKDEHNNDFALFENEKTGWPLSQCMLAKDGKKDE